MTNPKKLSRGRKVKRISKRGKHYVQFTNGILLYIPKTMRFLGQVTIEGIVPNEPNL